MIKWQEIHKKRLDKKWEAFEKATGKKRPKDAEENLKRAREAHG
jgi:hypothetical protein